MIFCIFYFIIRFHLSNCLWISFILLFGLISVISVIVTLKLNKIVFFKFWMLLTQFRMSWKTIQWFKWFMWTVLSVFWVHYPSTNSSYPLGVRHYSLIIRSVITADNSSTYQYYLRKFKKNCSSRVTYTTCHLLSISISRLYFFTFYIKLRIIYIYVLLMKQ